MGKYNFNTQKIADLEKRIAEMEARNHELEKMISESGLGLLQNKKKRRIITKDIEKTFDAKKLFCVKLKNDNRDTEAIYKSNFQVFYQNIFRALDPVERKDNRPGLTYKPVNELTDKEYEVYISCLDACLEIVSYSQDKLKKIKEEK